MYDYPIFIWDLNIYLLHSIIFIPCGENEPILIDTYDTLKALNVKIIRPSLSSSMVYFATPIP